MKNKISLTKKEILRILDRAIKDSHKSFEEYHQVNDEIMWKHCIRKSQTLAAFRDVTLKVLDEMKKNGSNMEFIKESK